MTVVKSDVIPSAVDDAPVPSCHPERSVAIATRSRMDPPIKRRGGFKFFPIVVAIIAVLVAIAVPLFVGEIDRAREATFEANYRAAKSAVVTAILKDTTKDLSTMSGKEYYTVKVNTETGDIGDITKAGSAKTANYKAWQETGKKEDGSADPTAGTIIVEIEKVDLTITAAAGG